MSDYGRAPASSPNYLMWMLTIAAGVLLGNLLSNLITARWMAYEAGQVVAAQQRELQKERQLAAVRAQQQSQVAQAALAETQRQQQAAVEHLRQQRAADAIGRRLTQACHDWQQADARYASPTTRSETARHCGRLERYLDSGVADAPR